MGVVVGQGPRGHCVESDAVVAAVVLMVSEDSTTTLLFSVEVEAAGLVASSIVRGVTSAMLTSGVVFSTNVIHKPSH